MSASAPRIDRAGHGLWRVPFARDVVVALVAFALTLLLLSHGAHGGLGATARSPRSLDVLGVALAAIACLALPWHRRWPLGVFVVATAASATINGLGYGLGPPFGATVALFYLAVDERTGDRLRQTGRGGAVGRDPRRGHDTVRDGVSHHPDPRRGRALGWRMDRRR